MYAKQNSATAGQYIPYTRICTLITVYGMSVFTPHCCLLSVRLVDRLMRSDHPSMLALFIEALEQGEHRVLAATLRRQLNPVPARGGSAKLRRQKATDDQTLVKRAISTLSSFPATAATESDDLGELTLNLTINGGM